MTIGHIFIFFVVGFCIGSVSFAAIIARINGVNILKEGSGSAGATNIKRLLGVWWGYGVFFLDMIKGMLAVMIAYMIPLSTSVSDWIGIIALMGAIMGHSFSVFLNFKGGKGVAVSMGGICLLAPGCLFVGIIAWLTLFFATRYVSVSSMAFGISLPVAAFFFRYSPLIIGFNLTLMLLIVSLHHKNIKRLMHGTENKFISNASAS